MIASSLLAIAWDLEFVFTLVFFSAFTLLFHFYLSTELLLQTVHPILRRLSASFNANPAKQTLLLARFVVMLHQSRPELP